MLSIDKMRRFRRAPVDALDALDVFHHVPLQLLVRLAVLKLHRAVDGQLPRQDLQQRQASLSACRCETAGLLVQPYGRVPVLDGLLNLAYRSCLLRTVYLHQQVLA